MSDTTEKKVLLTVSLEVKQMYADLATTKKAIADLKAEQKGLDQTTEQGRKAYEAYGAEIRNLTATAKEQQKTIDNTIKANNAEKDSLQQLKAQLSLLTAEYNKLSKEQREAPSGQQKAQDIKAMSDELKKQEKQLGDSRRGMGEYERGIGGVTNTMSQLPGAAGSTTKSLLETGKAMWAIVANPIGLILTGIMGAFYALYLVFKDFKPIVDKVEQSLAALGAVFEVVKNTVIGLFTGQKSLTESTKGLGTAMSNAAKDAIELKKAQQELEDSQASLDVQNKRAETQMQRLLLQSKNRTLSEQERIVLIDKAMKIETDIHNRKASQNDKEVKAYEDKLIIGKNLTSNEIERLRKEGVAYARLLQDKKGITDEEINGLRDALLKREDINQESVSLQEKAQNRRDVLADKAQSDEEKRQAKAIQAAEKASQELEKRQEKELKSMQNILDLKIKKQKDFDSEMLATDTYYTKRIDMINSNWSDEKKIIDKELQYKKINAEEASLKYIDAEKKKNDSVKSLNQAKLNQIVSSLQYELSLHRLKDDEIIATSKQTAKQQHEAELLRIQQDKAEQIKEQNAKLASDPGYQAERDRQVELIRQKGRTATAQANAAWEEKERQRKLSTDQMDLSNELAIAQGTIDREYELKLKGLEAQKAAELLAAETTGASVALINEKYAKLEEDQDAEKFKKKFESIKQYAEAGMGVLSGIDELQKQIEAGQLADAEEKNTAKTKELDDRLKRGLISQKEHDKQVAASANELDKKKRKIAYDQAVREKELNVLRTIINTASAVVSAIAQFPGPVGIALGVAAGITGGIELGAILAAPLPKAATGGLIVGKSHAQGGATIEAEGGEMIVNKRATTMFGGILKMMNDLGNGKNNDAMAEMSTALNSFNGSSNAEFKSTPIPLKSALFSDGGYAARHAGNETLTKDDIEQAMENAVAKVKVITTIEDIKKGDENYTKIQDRANY